MLIVSDNAKPLKALRRNCACFLTIHKSKTRCRIDEFNGASIWNGIPGGEDSLRG